MAIATTKELLLTACEARRQWEDWLKDTNMEADPDAMLARGREAMEAMTETAADYNLVHGIIAGFAALSDLTPEEICERIMPCFTIRGEGDGR